MTLAAVAEATLAAYIARWPLYAALALAAFAIQYLVMLATPSLMIALITQIVIDAAVGGAVCYGTATSMAGEATTALAILDRTLERLWALVIVNIAVGIVTLLTASGIVGGPDETGFGITIIPTLFIWGLFSLPLVAAALEDEKMRGGLIGGSFVLAWIAAMRSGSFLRVILAGAVVAAPLLLQVVLEDVLHLRGIHHVDFWANVPLDALTVGPFAAFLTVFYTDLRRRAGVR